MNLLLVDVNISQEYPYYPTYDLIRVCSIKFIFWCANSLQDINIQVWSPYKCSKN